MVNQVFSFLRSAVNETRMSNSDNPCYSCQDFTGNSFISHNWVITPDNTKCGNGNNIVPHPHAFVRGRSLIQTLVCLIVVVVPFIGNCNQTMGASSQASMSFQVINSDQPNSAVQASTASSNVSASGPIRKRNVPGELSSM